MQGLRLRATSTDFSLLSLPYSFSLFLSLSLSVSLCFSFFLSFSLSLCIFPSFFLSPSLYAPLPPPLTVALALFSLFAFHSVISLSTDFSRTTNRDRGAGADPQLFIFFFALDTGPSRSLSLSRVIQEPLRLKNARLRTTAHFCEVVDLSPVQLSSDLQHKKTGKSTPDSGLFSYYPGNN